MTPTPPTWWDRYRYRFDRAIAEGPHRLLYVLGAASSVLIVVGAGLLAWVGEQDYVSSVRQFCDALWISFVHTIDPTTISPDEKGSERLIMLLLAIGGLFCVGSLIGILSSATEERLRAVRGGRSPVLETGHTLLLGWNSASISVLSELLEARGAHDRTTIVVLANRDRVDLEDAVGAHFGRGAMRRVVVRSGDPVRPEDLSLANPAAAASILVLATDDDEDSDSRVITTLLALSNLKSVGVPPRVTAELRNIRNLAAARTACRPGSRIVVSDDFLARIAVQACRQPGLGVVYTDLLDFAGAEIQFRSVGALVGRPFREALRMFADAALIGVRRGGRVLLLPPMEECLADRDELVVVARGRAAARALREPQPFDEASIRAAHPPRRRSERTLLLGWNRHATAILRCLDADAAGGSEVVVVSDVGDPESDIARCRMILRNQTVKISRMSHMDRDVLAGLELSGFNRALVLCCSDDLPGHRADAQVLCTLLHLRSLCDERRLVLPIVSEILDPRTSDLATSIRVDDFIVSARIVSLALTQIAEHPARADVLEELLSPEGSEIYFRRAAHYVVPGRPVTFRTVVESAARRNEIAVGWWREADRTGTHARFGIELVPDADSMIRCDRADRVIVLAQS